MEIGIIDYLLRLKEEACFYMAQGLGFDCLEFSVDAIGDPSRLLFDPERSNELVDLWEATGVRVSSVCATHYIRESLLAPEDAHRQPAVLAFQSLIERVGRLGISTVVLPLYGASELKEERDLGILRVVLQKASEWAAMHQVRIALKSSLPADQLVGLIDHLQSGWIGVCYDPANSLPMQRNIREEIRSLGSRIFHVHFKDRLRTGAAARLGEGDVDLGDVLKALREIGYRGPLILETPAGKSAIDAAKINLSYCRENLMVA